MNPYHRQILFSLAISFFLCLILPSSSASAVSASSSSSSASDTGVYTLSNEVVSISFSSSAQLLSLTSYNTSLLTSSPGAWWRLVAVSSSPSSQSYNSSSLPLALNMQMASGVDTHSLNITYEYELFQLVITWSLSSLFPDIHAAAIITSLSPSLGVDSFIWVVPGVVADKMSVVWPTGFGVLVEQPLQYWNKPYSANYPSSEAAYQLMMLHPPSSGPGLSFAALDDTAAQKTFGFEPLVEQQAFALTITVYPGDGTLPLPPSSSLSLQGVVLSSFNGDWYDGSAGYEQFAKNAPWTSAGVINERKDMPRWALDSNVWLNTGWQQHDVFNVSQGAPSMVLQRVSNVVQHINITSPIGLHWYEWDSYLFDTNYPDYFPPRANFSDVLAQLQGMNVRVAPYINGRIYDVGTARWSTDHAQLFAAKNSQTGLQPQPLSLYEESYGSGSTFAVMCPATSYWQNTLLDVVQKLIALGVDGVYIDQIGAAAPKRCFDASHNHDIGGGRSWVDGYNSLLELVRQSPLSFDVNAASASQAPAQQQPQQQQQQPTLLLTESNAEPYMAHINVYLTLVAFSFSPSGPVRTVPVFPRLYGGLYTAMGAEFFVSDFDDPRVFNTKIAWMFNSGAQIGWFSLGGTSDPPPMGLYDLLMDPTYLSSVQFLQLLDAYRTQAYNFLVVGRRTRDVDVQYSTMDTQDYMHAHSSRDAPLLLRASSPSSSSSSSSSKLDTFTYEPLMSSVWLPAVKSCYATDMLAVILTASVSDVYSVKFQMSLADYGVFAPSGSTWSLLRLDSSGHVTNLGQFGPEDVVFQCDSIKQNDVVLLNIVRTDALQQWRECTQQRTSSSMADNQQQPGPAHETPL